MKIAMTADVHIDKNKNLPYVIETCKWIGDYCDKNGIDTLFIAGDFINSRIKVDMLAYNNAIFILDYFEEKGINTFLLLGNHELYHRDNIGCEKTEITSIKSFKKQATIIETYKKYVFDNTTFHFIPWISNKDNYKKTISDIQFNNDDVIISHAEVYGAYLNNVSDVTDNTGLETNMFGVRTFLGHYHKRQILGNVEYVGSPLALNFSETDKKGILVFDTQTKESEFVENPNGGVYVNINLSDLDKKELYENAKFIRISSKSLSQEEKDDIVKDYFESEQQIFFKPVHEETSDSNIEIENRSIMDVVDEYVDLNINDLEKVRLMEIGKHYLNKVSTDVF